MKYRCLIIMLVLLILSCKQQPESSQCAAPMIKVGNECCPDSNKNGLCDDLELSNNMEISKSRIESETANEEKPKYSSLLDIQTGINKTYYPLKRYIFNYTDKYNLTGLENIFNVSGADRFYILQIKKEHNYLYNEKNFSDFIKRRYDLRVKNNGIWDQEYVDYKKQSVYGWEDVIARYDHSLEKIDVLGKPAYLEKHYEIFDQKGNLKDFYLEYKIDIWCTPEMVVVIYPSDKFWFIYTIGSFVETELKYVNGLLKKEYENMYEDAEKIQKLCNGNPDFMGFVSNEIVFYGMDGFYPTEIKIKTGDKLRLHNENDYNNAEIFTFMRQEPYKVFISGEVNYTSYEDIKFDEPGNYTFFTPHYAGRANVIVE